MPPTLSRFLLPVAVLLGSVTLPATPAVAQQACGPAGGADGSPPISQIQTEEEAPSWDREVSQARLDPVAPDAHDVVFSGGGWGHGVGLSQYAAQGAATLGCSWQEIIQTHFPNSGIERRDSRAPLRLKVWSTGTSGTASVWAEDQVTWRTCKQQDSGAIVSGSCAKLVDQPAGTSVDVSLTATGWHLQGGEIDEKVADRTHTLLELLHDGTLVRVRQGEKASKDTGLPIRYGRFELDYTSLKGGRLFATQIIGNRSASGLPAIETYLLGLAEVPFGWHQQALRTQVVAARSYAEATARARQSYTDAQRIDIYDCRCDLRVDTGDQVWAGATKELAEAAYYPRWQEAVGATTGHYVVRNGNVLTTFYSSSFGGHSRRGFSNVDPNYPAVDVSRWEKASRTDWSTPAGGRYRWSQGFSRAELERAFGIDDIDGIRVVDTDDAAGYPTRVEVTGVDAGEPVTWTYNDPYQQIRSRLGLYSPRFAIHTITDLADDTQIPVSRLSGDTRLGTAIGLSEAGWSDGADTVVLARADDPADSLTGSALAGTRDAPLLLTPTDGLDDDVATELMRLDPDRVLLLGGLAALSRQVESDVRKLGITTVERVSGPSRFGTAVDVATEVARGGQTTAYLVRLQDAQVASRGWVDALSVAAVAARRAGDGAGWPILGTAATLPAETRRAIGHLGVERVVPVGGPATVPQSVLEELASMGVEVADRLAGADRYGTSRAVTASDAPTAESLVIATGENFPDGLAAGPFAARTGAALLLVPTGLHDGSPWGSQEHPALIRNLGWADPSLVAVGGPRAITNNVVHRVSNLLENAAS